MKYVRTKDGRIVEECNLEPGLKQTCITLIRKRDNKTLTQIICDDMDNYVEMIAVGEYCKCHKINPKDIKLERIALLNEVLKQSDSIEELCDGFVVISEEYDEPHYVKKLIDTNALDFRNNWKPYGKGKVLDQTCQKLIDAIIYGAIWTDKGLIYVAKMNEKGELELL